MKPRDGVSATSVYGLSGWRRAAPNGELARVLLAFLASAGIFYSNMMPALVDGLVAGAGFSNREAGLTGSANLYGTALGALAAVWMVRRVSWRTAACVLLAGLLVIDLLSMLVRQFEPLLVLRFVHGLLGGALCGTGFSVIARTREADRSFGYLILVQFSLGGVAVMVVPPLVPEYGTWVLYVALVGFSGLTLLMLPFLDEYPVTESRPHGAVHPRMTDIRWRLLAPSLLAIFAFQVGNMGVFAYVIGIGEAAGHSTAFASRWIGISSWVALAGAALAVVLSTRVGRARPLGSAILLAAASAWALHRSNLAAVYVVANCVFGIALAAGIPYLLGLAAAFDRSGQAAALGGFASKMGLASGPMLAALVVGDGEYARVIDIGTGAFVLALFFASVPVLVLDREAGARRAPAPPPLASATEASD